MMTVDWETLFFKYAAHVGNEEGVDFLTYQEHETRGEMIDGQWMPGERVKWCTDEEWAAIQSSPKAEEY
jgi:hypothetical protein